MDTDSADALDAPRAVLLVDPNPIRFDAAVDCVSNMGFSREHAAAEYCSASSEFGSYRAWVHVAPILVDPRGQSPPEMLGVANETHDNRMELNVAHHNGDMFGLRVQIIDCSFEGRHRVNVCGYNG